MSIEKGFYLVKISLLSRLYERIILFLHGSPKFLPRRSF
jgi:hypothetical protein